MEETPQRRAFIRVSSLICVLLVALVGFIQAVHVHVDDSKLPSHECSICAVAHSGVVGQAQYRPVPVVVRTVLVAAPDAAAKSSGVVFSLRIRPPPTV
jgi:hypothetical protein